MSQRRYISPVAAGVALFGLAAIRYRDGGAWPIFAAYAVSLLLAWRLAWQVHMVPAVPTAGNGVLSHAAREAYRQLGVRLGLALVALCSLLWLL